MQKEKIHKTLNEIGVYDGFDYEVMTAFCFTLCALSFGLKRN